MMTMVVNPYRVALGDAWGRAGSVSSEMRTQLDGVVTHFEAGAWVGGLAGQMFTMLKELQQDLKTVAERSENDCGAAYWSQDELVDADAWQVHWRNLIGG